MGTNNLATKNDGDNASASDVNQYKTALSGDLVPRNSSGVPQDESSNFGLSAFRWLKGFFTSIRIGSVSADNTIEEDSGNMIFKIDGTTKATIGSGGISNSSLAVKNHSYSDGFGKGTTSETFEQLIWDFSITPSRAGAMILITSVPTTNTIRDHYVSTTSNFGQIRISIAGVDVISTNTYDVESGQSSVGVNVVYIAPSAAPITIESDFRRIGSSGGFSAFARFLAVEL